MQSTIAPNHNSNRLVHYSSAFSEIFAYLPYFEQLKLQSISRHFYKKVIPRCLY